MKPISYVYHYYHAEYLSLEFEYILNGFAIQFTPSRTRRALSRPEQKSHLLRKKAKKII